MGYILHMSEIVAVYVYSWTLYTSMIYTSTLEKNIHKDVILR